MVEVTDSRCRSMLLDLLAVIHRDGGHKVEELGIELAWQRGMQLSSERIAGVQQGLDMAAGVVKSMVQEREEELHHLIEGTPIYAEALARTTILRRAGAAIRKLGGDHHD